MESGVREASGASPVLMISSDRSWIPVDFGELWRYRELLWLLTFREITGRYRQSLLGPAWAIIQPIMTMVVFSILFGLLMGKEGRPTLDGIPYPICTFCALVPWQLFSKSVARAGGSLVTNQALITKVYFPRIIVPASTIFGSLVDFVLAFIVLILMIIGYDVLTDYNFQFSWALLALPVWVMLAVLTALSLALWTAALNAILRDVGYAMPQVVQIWMYLTPVVYTTESVMGDQPDWVRFVFALNPMAGVAEGFRWSLLGSQSPPVMTLVVSTCVVLILIVFGLYFFRRMERIVADLV